MYPTRYFIYLTSHSISKNLAKGSMVGGRGSVPLPRGPGLIPPSRVLPTPATPDISEDASKCVLDARPKVHWE